MTVEIPSEAEVKENEQINLNEPQKSDAEDENLKLLGEVTKNVEAGPEIHDAVATRWNKILENGLNTEIKENLVKKYPAPKNCEFLNAPENNPQIKSILHKFIDNKDGFSKERQNQLGSGITAIGQILTTVLNSKKEDINPDLKALIIEKLGDSGRIFTDVFNDLSKRRRSSI